MCPGVAGQPPPRVDGNEWWSTLTAESAFPSSQGLFHLRLKSLALEKQNEACLTIATFRSKGLWDEWLLWGRMQCWHSAMYGILPFFGCFLFLNLNLHWIYLADLSKSCNWESRVRQSPKQLGVKGLLQGHAQRLTTLRHSATHR